MMNKKLLAARIVMTALTVGAILFIFSHSMADAEESAQESGPLLEWINRLLCSLNIPFEVTEFMVRKAAHFTEYGVLGVLLSVTMYLYLQKRGRMLFAALAAGAPVAVCDELIQLTSEGRSCEVRDMLIDFCGVLLAALMVWIFISILEKRRSRTMKEG